MAGMEQQEQLRQIAKTLLKQDSTKDLHLASNGYSIATLGSGSDIVIMEVMNGTEFNDKFPYCLSTVPIAQERVCTHFANFGSITELYEKGGVQVSQEVAMDPVYLPNPANEPFTAKVAGVSWAPSEHLGAEDSIIGTLSSFGALQVLAKKKRSRQWERKFCDIHNLFIREVFPRPKTTAKLSTLCEYKELIDKYWITAFAWDSTIGAQLMYTANASGDVVAFKFDADYMSAREYCKAATGLAGINFLKSFDNFIMASNVHGVVHLFQINRSSATPSICKVECLWSKTDRMALRRAAVVLSAEHDCYFLMFSKGAHILAFCLTRAGTIRCSSSLYVGGIKVTGFEVCGEGAEFIVATMTGVVRRIRLSCPGDELLIHEEIIPNNLDMENFQVLGLAASTHRNLWSFLMGRNREYTHQSKSKSTFGALCITQLTSNDSLGRLSSLSIRTMDEYKDYVMEVHLEVILNLCPHKYSTFYSMQNAVFPLVLNDAFLQKLQIKLIITESTLVYQNVKLRNVRQSTICEKKFLVVCIRLVHILVRLRYLHETESKGPLSRFQTLAAACMQAKFPLLIAELSEMVQRRDNPLKNAIERFLKLCNDEWEASGFRDYKLKEQCILCDAAIRPATLMCRNNHAVQRCCVSFTQVPFIRKHFCAQCKTVALLDTGELKSLFDSNTNKVITCTFCRFMFEID